MNLFSMLLLFRRHSFNVREVATVSACCRQQNYHHHLRQHRRLSSVPGGRVSVSITKKESDAFIPFDLTPPKGTRDMYPEDKRLHDYLMNVFTTTSKSHGFESIATPLLERTDLFLRKNGEDVGNQLYRFTDQGGNDVCLRPEATPSLARMIIHQQQQQPLQLPIKWFSLPQCYRYERTSRGRRREHFQWNADIVGVHSVLAEAELLTMVVTAMRKLGLTAGDVVVHINHRGILEGVLAKLGVTEVSLVTRVLLCVDKLDKLPVTAIIEQLVEIGLQEEVSKTLVDIVQNKDFAFIEEFLGSDHKGVRDIAQLFQLTSASGYDIADWLKFNLAIVRGLTYYTGVVFEVFDSQRKFRAICGGGRYDELLSNMSQSAVALPSVGFGFGDAVIVEILKEKQLLPSFQARVVDIVVYPMLLPTTTTTTTTTTESTVSNTEAENEHVLQTAISLATQLRQHSSLPSVELLLLPHKKPKAVFAHAAKVHAKRVVMVAPDELKTGAVVVKNIDVGSQQVVPLAQAVNVVFNLD